MMLMSQLFSIFVSQKKEKQSKIASRLRNFEQIRNDHLRQTFQNYISLEDFILIQCHSSGFFISKARLSKLIY